MNFQTFKHSGFSFSYSVEGTGPVVLIPGGPVHYSQTFGEDLRNNYQFIFVDHRGFAVPDDAQYSLPGLDELIEDIEAFRRHLNLKEFYILGHSGHAYLALAYAYKYQDNLKGLILLAAGPDLTQGNREAADQYFEEMADQKRKDIHFKNMEKMQQEMSANPGDQFRIFCIRSAARSSFLPEFDPTPLWKDMNLNLNIVFHMWSGLFAERINGDKLTKLELPVFIGMGLHDYLVPPHYTWNPYKKFFKNLTFRIFGRSGHNPQMEESAAFLEELNHWMKKN